MSDYLELSTDTTAFPWVKRTPYAGLPAVATIALLLIVGQATGHASAGAIAAGTAFTVGFAVFHEALASTLLSMGMLTVGVASATLIGSLSAEWTPLVLLVTCIAAMNFGLLSDLGPTAGWMGQQCAVFAIIASYFPLGVHYAVGRSSMVLLGGAVEMLVFTLVNLRRHRATEAALPPSAGSLSHRLRLRIAELWVKLRTEVARGSATWSYILRLGLTLLLCTAIYRHYGVRNGYWSPMTAVLVLKPRWADTLNRGIARLSGTMVGAGIAVLLAWYLPLHHQGMIFALVITCCWICYALQAVNYAVFSVFMTLYIIFLMRYGGFSQTAAAHIRLFNTALGGGIALLIDAVWLLFKKKDPRQLVK